MRETIAFWALGFSIGAFLLYLVTAGAQVIAQFTAADGVAKATAVPNVTGFFSAIRDLAEALSKASPSVVALIASISYLTLAALAGGVLGTG